MIINKLNTQNADFKFLSVNNDKVCILIPPFAFLNSAHQKTFKHRSMVVESKA